MVHHYGDVAFRVDTPRFHSGATHPVDLTKDKPFGLQDMCKADLLLRRLCEIT